VPNSIRCGERGYIIETGTAGQSPLVGRLHPDPEVARHAAFALFALVFLESIGLAERRLTAPGNDTSAARDRRLVAAATAAVAALTGQNPHLFCFFSQADNAAALGEIDPAAARELIGWTAAQRVEQEEPQIAYELGMLALGVELPSILVGSLRELALREDSTVAESPDGSGYPTVFLSTLHPKWDAARQARLFVGGTDAEQLAAWAMVLLSRTIAPPPGSVVRVAADNLGVMRNARYDVALVYNPVPWLGGAADYEQVVPAEQVIVL
jgi:hypothetical protein